jgi:hypothetical protein
MSSNSLYAYLGFACPGTVRRLVKSLSVFVSHLAARKEVQMQMQEMRFERGVAFSSFVSFEKLINQMRIVWVIMDCLKELCHCFKGIPSSSL